MSNIIPFNHESGKLIRTVNMDGEIWFVAKDVCEILGLENVSKALVDLDNEDKNDLTGSKVGCKISKLRIINESGLYHLIFKSRKSEAKKFKRWVTSEVLPQIRKTGSYSTVQPVMPAFIRRACANHDKVSPEYFSVISELVTILYGKFEMAGYVIPDTGINGQEVRPDISVGKLFAAWLEKNQPEDAHRFKYYIHTFPDGVTVKARQYELDLLPDFRRFVEANWFFTRAKKYLSERIPEALDFLPKLLRYKA